MVTKEIKIFTVIPLMNKNIVFLLLASILPGCDSGKINNEDFIAAAIPLNVDDAAQFYAQIHTETLKFGEGTSTTSIISVFSKFREPTSAAYIESFHKNDPGCTVKRQTISELKNDQDELTNNFPLSQFVSAGDVLTIIAPEGSLSDMVRNPNANNVGTYEIAQEFLDTDLLLTSDSVLHIPGETFPPVDGVDIALAEPLENVVAMLDNKALRWGEDSATSDTVFQWNASSISDSRVILWVRNISYDDEGDISLVSSVVCNVADIGLFSFPIEMHHEMDGSYTSYGLKREIIRIEKRENILISLQSTSRYVQ